MEDYDCEDERLHCTAPEGIPGYPTRVPIIDRSDEAELEDGDMLESTDREIATIARIVSENKGQPVLTSRNRWNDRWNIGISLFYREMISAIPAMRKLSTIRGSGRVRSPSMSSG